MTDPTPRAPRRNTDPCAEAFRRGHRAALVGQGRETCPFVEGAGRPTWTRSYRLAWQRGWDMGEQLQEQSARRPPHPPGTFPVLHAQIPPPMPDWHELPREVREDITGEEE